MWKNILTNKITTTNNKTMKTNSTIARVMRLSKTQMVTIDSFGDQSTAKVRRPDDNFLKVGGLKFY